ncbi:MAG: GAF domain-containing protein [Pseudomonadota bacterium]
MQTGLEHVDCVVAAARSRSAAARSPLVASWRRSMVTHGLDPADDNRLSCLTDGELAEHRQRAEGLLLAADRSLNHLFSLVRLSGCAVFLTDRHGIVLDQRCADADSSDFLGWNLRPGADWSEVAEGTNGIGTCLVERRRVVVHRDEHFSLRNISMSCIDAPLFGPAGELIGALDVSSARADQSHALNGLICEAVCQIARQIENDLFYAAFPDARIIVCGGEVGGAPALVAVDEDDVVLGANRAARRRLQLPLETPLTPRAASDLLGTDAERPALEAAERKALKGALLHSGGNVTAAAQALGIGRATLYRRMKRLGVSK